MDHIECVVIGAGVIGLAIARALSKAGRDVSSLTRDRRSAPIRPRATVKSFMRVFITNPQALWPSWCAPGRKALYAYCESRNVAHKRCGKLIVATTPAEVQRLDEIARHARGNGVDDLIVLTKDEATALEPALSCEGALLSPSTGIIDSHGYMLALLADAEAHGTIIAYRSRFTHATPRSRGFAIHIETGDGETMGLSCTILVNAGGLHAPAVAARIAGSDGDLIFQPPTTQRETTSPQRRACHSRGSSIPFRLLEGLAYISRSISRAGRASVPTWNGSTGLITRWTRIVPRSSTVPFGDIGRDCLTRAFSRTMRGFRPKIVPPAIAKQDFVISGAASHGLPGLVNLFGMSCPD